MKGRLYYGIFISILTLTSLVFVSVRVPDVQAATGDLHVTTMPTLAVQMTWNGTNTPTTTFDITHTTPFIVQSLTAPAPVTTVSGVTYYFNHWELDGTDLGTSYVIASITVGGSQPSGRTATAYYLPTSPVSSSVSPIFGASANSVYYLGNTNPYDNQALVGVWAKSTNPEQYIGLWKNPSWVNQATGAPLVTNNLVLVAGPIANKVVGYYASLGLTPGFRFGGVSGVSYAQIILGNHVIAQMRESDIGTGKDMFVVHVFKDGSRFVLVTWGIGAQGTLASGIWIVSNFSTFSTLTTNGLYVFQWTDGSNGNPLDGFPQPGEITPLYAGN
jgi:hypothetical protein